MSLNELCERCGKSESSWTVREWRIEVGELNRKPHLCESCTRHIQGVLVSALQPLPRWVTVPMGGLGGAGHTVG